MEPVSSLYNPVTIPVYSKWRRFDMFTVDLIFNIRFSLRKLFSLKVLLPNISVLDKLRQVVSFIIKEPISNR